MKPVLVLGPTREGTPSLERRHVDICRPARAEQAVINDAAYSAVVVINDGSAQAIQRLLQALAMRRSQPTLSVGVVTWLEGSAVNVDLGTLHGRPVAWVDAGSRLRIELKPEALSVEYQAV